MASNGARQKFRNGMFASRTHYLQFLSVFYVLLAVIGAFILWQMAASQIRSSHEKHLHASIDTFSLILENTITGLTYDISALAQNNTVQVTLDLGIFPQLRRYLEKKTTLDRMDFVYVLDSEAEELISMAEESDGLDSTLLCNKSKSDLVLLGERFFYVEKLPIQRKGKKLGYICAGIELSLPAKIESYKERIHAEPLISWQGKNVIAPTKIQNHLTIYPDVLDKVFEIKGNYGPYYGLLSSVKLGSESVIIGSVTPRTGLLDSSVELIYSLAAIMVILALGAFLAIDLQRRKMQLAELQEARKLSEEANLAKSEFLANMSHEFRTPLHAILGFSDLGEAMSRSDDQGKMNHYFTRIQESGRRLLLLVNDLLDLSKLEAGRMEFHFENHDLFGIVDRAVQELEKLIQGKSLQIIVERPKINTEAYIDNQRILQVVINLLSNAIKFTPEGKLITVSFNEAEMPGGRRSTDSDMVPGVSITVEDEGPGIPEDELDAVFDKFIQSRKTVSAGDGKGTGLGLAISREIVEGHGGSIFAANSQQGGAVITVIVPQARPEVLEQADTNRVPDSLEEPVPSGSN